MAHGERPSQALRYTAFADGPGGGNPAGVVLDATAMDASGMQRLAADIGYSETAFVTADLGAGRLELRYFSPLAEVPFCGHATVATAVALADYGGPMEPVFATRAGDVALRTVQGDEGYVTTLTSVEPAVDEPPAGLLDEALARLGWEPGELDGSLPPRVAYAGARHLVLAAASRDRLARLEYDFDGLTELMRLHDLTTLQLVWRDEPLRFFVRNPFPVGGVVEDPATGAAAAAFGGYLRELGLVDPPASAVLLQGQDMGRPSRLEIEIPIAGGIRVTGGARPI